MLADAGIKAGDYDLLYSGATIARFAALQSGAVSAWRRRRQLKTV
jgi:hypothetical protein